MTGMMPAQIAPANSHNQRARLASLRCRQALRQHHPLQPFQIFGDLLTSFAVTADAVAHGGIAFTRVIDLIDEAVQFGDFLHHTRIHIAILFRFLN